MLFVLLVFHLISKYDFSFYFCLYTNHTHCTSFFPGLYLTIALLGISNVLLNAHSCALARVLVGCIVLKWICKKKK